MLIKRGVLLQIRKAGKLDEVVSKGKKEIPSEKKYAGGGDFLYFAAKAISGDEPNGNGDYFPWAQLLKSFSSFIGRNLFLNHNSGDPRNAIGKVLDAYPVIDPSTGEKYIECLAKIDAFAHPDLARQVSTGILDSCSMGCSVESSTCSICGCTIHSDQDDKCDHMSHGLLKEYVSELDFPDYGIKKGSATRAFAINQGLNFTELSVVNVPAWNNAKIVQVIAKLKESKVTPDMVKDLEDLLKMASDNMKKEGEEKEVEKPTDVAPVAAPENPNIEEKSKESRIQKLFKEKLSALDYMDLLDFMTKKVEVKAEEITPVPAPVVEITKPEEPKVEVKAEETPKVEVPAPVVEAPKVETPVVETPKTEELKSTLKAIFVAKSEMGSSYWVVTDSGRPMLKATLNSIWGTRLNDVIDYAASADYGEALLQRLQEDGVEKVAKLTNATIYAEASKSHPEGLDLATKPTPPAQRGQVGKGEEWPSQKPIGRDQYTPAAPSHPVKMKELEEGVDMSGGSAPPAQKGPGWAGGDKAPSSKAIGKSQYSAAGGGGPKAKSEYMEKTAAPDMPEAPLMEKPVELAPEVKPMAEMPPVEAPVGDLPGAGKCEYLTGDDHGKMEHMEELLGAIGESKDITKALAAAHKAVEKLELALAKAEEKAAKEAEKEQAAADKAKAKEEKAAEKEEKKEEKPEPKEEKPEPKEKGENPFAKKEEKPKEEKMEKTAEELPKVETPVVETPKTEEVKPEIPVVPEQPIIEKKAEETPKVEEPVVEAPQVSERERELEAQLRQMKIEQSLREKVGRCQMIVSEMLDKDLISPDEADIQAEVASGKPLFDARAAALKNAIDKQCKDLLAMEEPTLKAFAQTVTRMKMRSSAKPGMLKKAFNLHYNENMVEDTWLNGVFNQMGSQKSRNQ